MRYLIFYKKRSGVCPKCGGMLLTLNSDTIILNCHDCNAFYKLVGEGQAESELEFEDAELKYS